MSPEALIRELVKSDRFTVQRLLQILDGRNIQLGTSVGTQLGTNALQKLGFFGTTPVPQSVFHFNTSASGTYGSTEQNILNGLQTELKKYGIIIG